MTAEAFDPISVEKRLIQRRLMPDAPAGDRPAGPPQGDDRNFTESDPRLYALWRISMMRQIHPDVLAGMPDGDLLFLAAQTSEGYPDEGLGGIALAANKVDQNAARARAELANRAGKLGQRHAIVTTLLGAVVGTVLGAALALMTAWALDGEGGGDDPPATTTSTDREATTTTIPTTTSTTVATPP